MKLALDQGYETVFTTTVVAAGILELLGWKLSKQFFIKMGNLHCISVNCDVSEQVRLFR